MNRAFRIAFHACIMLSVAVFAGCSDDDPAPPTGPGPDPGPGVAGTIGVYADDTGTDRNIVDTGGVVTLYVFHKITDGGTASQFKVEAPAGWSLMGSDDQYLSLGDIGDGIAYAYGGCLSGSIHVATLTYQSPGNSAGSSFRIVPDTSMNHIAVMDCSQNRLTDGVGLTSTVSQP